LNTDQSELLTDNAKRTVASAIPYSLTAINSRLLLTNLHESSAQSEHIMWMSCTFIFPHVHLTTCSISKTGPTKSDFN